MEVKIRPLQDKDAYTSVVWRNIPEIWKMTGSSPDREITIEDELNWIKKVINEETSRRCAIVADGVYVGNIYLTDIGNKTAELHIFIGDKRYWGKGVAKEATRQIIDYAKDTLRLDSVYLEVRRENSAARKVYEKIGFEEKNNNKEFIIMLLKLRHDGGRER
jgi:diamine N-acetyltransferase